MMKVKATKNTVFGCVWLVALLLSSCCEFCGEKELCESDSYIRVKVYSGQRDITATCLYGYGIGKENQKIFPTPGIHWTQANGTANDTAFVFPIDANHDTSRFCLVNRDLSIDSLDITYRRKFNVNSPCGYGFVMEQPKLPYVSSGIQNDSSYFVLERQWYHYMKILVIKKQ